jgi:hypothetical protein
MSRSDLTVAIVAAIAAFACGALIGKNNAPDAEVRFITKSGVLLLRSTMRPGNNVRLNDLQSVTITTNTDGSLNFIIIHAP